MALLKVEQGDSIGSYERFEKLGLFSYDSLKSTCYIRKDFKTMCLFFDRIYIDLFDFDALRFQGGNFPDDSVFLSHEITGGIANYIQFPTYGRSNLFIDPEEQLKAYTVGVITEANKLDYAFIPIYGSIFPNEEILNVPKDNNSIEIALQLFPSINEKNLSWEQVNEVRNDIESIGGIQKVQNLLGLFKGCNSLSEANDKLNSKIESYKQACNKHGVKTIKTSINQIYNKETLITTFGSAVATGMIELGLLLGGIKLINDIGFTVYESIRDKIYLNKNHAEARAAIVYKKLEE